MTFNRIHLLKNDPFLYNLVFVILERISVLFDQLQSTASTWHKNINSRHKNKNKHFIRSLREIFSALIYSLSSYESCVDDSEKKKLYTELLSLYESVILLSDELVILPKPDILIELYRFLRIFNREGIADQSGESKQGSAENENSNEVSEISNETKFVLYSGVDCGTVTYENHPLKKYENMVLIPTLRNVYSDAYAGLTQENDESYHISIPREETQNPLSWPVLAHEVGHQVMKWALLEHKNIVDAFFKDPYRNEYHKAFIRQLSRINEVAKENTDKKDVLGSWLTECWCDIYAYFATGPAILFAQRNAFVLQRNWHRDIGTSTHPSFYLRLLVLEHIFENHQWQFDYPLEYDVSPLNFSLSDLLKHENEKVLDDAYEIAMWFASFFNDHFKMDDKGTENVKQHVKKLKAAAQLFDNKILKRLVDRLNGGYPIPSISLEENISKEVETSIYDIMLAAWVSHDTALCDEVMNEFFSHIGVLHNSQDKEQWKVFEENIAPYFERFNQAVLRSLQISEWVSLLKPKNTDIESQEPVRSNTEKCEENSIYIPAVLVDREIKKLLEDDELKVIPLIDLKTQLGSASLDIRLGPTFQTYQPNQSGVIDFTNPESVQNVLTNSSIVDLDFKTGIVLAPGQFVLAHTMEYFGFPNSVAAQIEGRSSFARLGVQVHMTANLIDPGFHGAITFEIYNAGPNPIRLFPGYRIGQLRFFRCNEPDTSYNKKLNAKYKGRLIFSTSLVGNDYEVERLTQK